MISMTLQAPFCKKVVVFYNHDRAKADASIQKDSGLSHPSGGETKRPPSMISRVSPSVARASVRRRSWKWGLIRSLRLRDSRVTICSGEIGAN